jgi:hypothetical protein
VAAQNKASILSKSDEEIASLMQNVALGGGFITSVVHNKWLQGAAEEDLGPVKEARDLLGFLGPYRQIGGEFERIYREKKGSRR